MMLCSIGVHKWGKWEYNEAEQGVQLFVDGVPGKRIMVTISRGRRICKRCGKEELSQEQVTKP